MPDRPSFWNTLGWGAYLACSWTWCIGMFLPVLLIRDFGWWSFPVFAIPNCLGAAAMGWVLRHRDAAAAVASVHTTAIRAFSITTVAFQFFFVSAIGGRMVQHDVANFSWTLGLLLGAMATFRPRRPHLSSLALLALSIVLMAWFLLAPGSPAPTPPTSSNIPGLALLAPICVFGFALSPYLDATFLNAAKHSYAPAAFPVGFLLLFPILITFTLAYAPSFLQGSVPGELGSLSLSAAPPIIHFHIAAQLGFTILVHARASISPAQARRASWNTGLVWLLCIVLLVVLCWFTTRTPKTFEFTYRLFMSFYGLIFPAYVWICMIPTLRSPTKPTRRQIAVWLIAITLAAPFYYLGFIELQYWALAPGVLIPLVARLAIGSRP